MPVAETDTAPVLAALLHDEQFRAEQNEDGQAVYLPTPAGRQRILDAFTSFVRVADLGHGALELSLVASLATRRIEEAAPRKPRSRQRRARKPANEEDKDDDDLSPTLH